MSKNRFIAILLIAFIFLGLFVTAKVRGTKKEVKTTEQIQKEVGIPVQTASVQQGKIEDTISVTGDLTALETAELSAKVGGKVAYVAAREGDPVAHGQVVIQLDRSDAEAALRQARAGLQAAEARLSQAKTSASVTEVQSSAAIQQAKAGLAAAQANLDKIKKGARNQERLMAENAVVTAKANLDNAQANLRRMKQLFGQGAIAQAQLDVAQTQYDVAKAQHDSAKQNLSLVEEGARSEDVRAAETQVTQAEEALRTAQAGAAQNALRQEDIRSAEAGVAQARAQLAMAQEQLSNTSIVSPINGLVSMRSTEPGQMAVPGMPLMQIVNTGSVFFQANVSETVVAKVKPGQSVGVSVDAFSGSSFMGTVERVYPAASTNTRSFNVRVRIPNPESKLKPGMFARGSVITGGNSSAVLVPLDSVEERQSSSIVFILDKGRAKMVPINKGLSNSEFVEALPPCDLKSDDVVVTSGHENLEDGTRVMLSKETAR